MEISLLQHTGNEHDNGIGSVGDDVEDDGRQKKTLVNKRLRGLGL